MGSSLLKSPVVPSEFRTRRDEWVPVASEVTTDRFADVSDLNFRVVRSFLGGMLVCCFAVRNGIL